MKKQSFGIGEHIYPALVGRGRGRGRGRSPEVVVENPLAFANRSEKPFVLSAVTALLNYRHSRENGEPQDNLETFPSAGFENLKISSVTNKPGDFWPDQSGRYWWRLTLEDGSINEDFSWAVDEKNSSGFIVYGPNDVKMEGFSWEEEDYLMISHYVKYTACGPIWEWMARKDRNRSARIEGTQLGYISVPQGRTCRYDSNMVLPNAPIAGLYSDDFSICCAVVLYKKDDITGQVKISYTHADQLVKYTQILHELQWIGVGSQMFLYYKSAAFGGGVLEEILDDFEPEAFEHREWGDGKDNFGLAITLDGAPKCYSRDNLPKLITHPQEWSMIAFYQINLALFLIDKLSDRDSDSDESSDSDEHSDSANVLQSQRLLFDGCAWRAPLLHDESFIPSAEKFYDHVFAQLPPEEGLSGKIVSPIIYRHLGSRLGLDMLINLTKSFLILAVKNNYQLLFNNELAYILKTAKTEDAPRIILDLVEDISERAKEDFTFFSSFEGRIDELPVYYKSEKTISELLGIYKLCLRWRQKDSHIDIASMIQDEHQMDHDMQQFTSSSSSSSTIVPQLEFQAIHEEYAPDADSQRQQSPTRTAPKYATFAYSDSTVPKEEVRSLNAGSLSAEKEEERKSPRQG